MATIIKAKNRGRAEAGVAFNLDDLSSAAEGRLDDVRRAAAQIVADAQQEAESVRASVQQEARDAAMREIDQLVDAKIASLLPALAQTVQQLEAARHEWLAHWERTAAHLAAAIAERIIHRQLEKDPEISPALIREALELAAGLPEIRVRLNFADHEALADHGELLADACGSIGKVEFVTDPNVAPGGCRIETQFGSIDHTIRAQLTRIEEELA